jgi:hypothetical protein
MNNLELTLDNGEVIRIPTRERSDSDLCNIGGRILGHRVTLVKTYITEVDENYEQAVADLEPEFREEK